MSGLASTDRLGRLSEPLAWSIYVFAAVATGLSILAKACLIVDQRYGFGLPVFIAGAIVFALLFPFVSRLALRYERAVAVLALAGIFIVLLVVAPKFAALHAIGRGTDQGDCIVVAGRLMLSGQWPYDSSQLWSHNPLSCGPAWVAMYAPLTSLLSYSVATLVLLLLSLAVLAATQSVDRAARFATLLALAAGFWLSLANGADLGMFGIILAVAVGLATSRFGNQVPVVIVIAILSVALSQVRLPFLLLPIGLFAGAAGRRRWLGLGLSLLSIAIWCAIYAINPASFVREGPMHVLSKFDLSLPLGLALLVAGALVFAALCHWLRRLGSATLILLYCTAILVPVSLLNLVQKFRTEPSLLDALTFWEGTSWLTGLACFAAWAVVRARYTANPVRPLSA